MKFYRFIYNFVLRISVKLNAIILKRQSNRLVNATNHYFSGVKYVMLQHCNSVT